MLSNTFDVNALRHFCYNRLLVSILKATNKAFPENETQNSLLHKTQKIKHIYFGLRKTEFLVTG